MLSAMMQRREQGACTGHRRCRFAAVTKDEDSYSRRRATTEDEANVALLLPPAPPNRFSPHQKDWSVNRTCQCCDRSGAPLHHHGS
jgi:hypothetical protein